jgi:acetoacetyl-CoA synthetase
MTRTKPIWTPSARRVAAASLTRFLGGHRDYASLYQWSIDEPEEFWSAVWRFCGMKSRSRWTAVREPDEGPRRFKWFPGATLNFAENLLRYNDAEPAIISWNEAGPQKRLTHRQLRDAVSRCRQALRGAGVTAGDRVAGWLPNIPETVIAMLATASLGAIWSSCSPDFGAEGVLDRFAQIEPKVLFVTDGYVYNGKQVSLLERTGEIVRRLPSLAQTVVVPYAGRGTSLKGIPRALRYDDFVAFYPAAPLEFDHFEFDHPLYILYSSGTTGLPKCLVHGAGGTLLQHLKELVLHTDVRASDRVFYHTTCGWMMWNWMVTSLATGAAIVLYDGSPLPNAGKDILWRMAAQEKVTIFGTSAKYLALAQKEGLEPGKTHDLSALRTVLSTGSPLAPAGFDYVYEKVAPDVCLWSISGGTEIISCFALGNPIAPVWRGELQTRGLGMRVEVYDEGGRSLLGKPGELVCSAPFPSMPLRFWNDPGDARYLASYFSVYPGVWRHGDWAEITEHGGVIIHGRSDTTLNPGGVRIGTAEIYRQVEQIDEVVECLAVGQAWEDDTRVVLFVRLRAGIELDDELKERIRRAVREGASPHHVPKRIVQVSDLPRTLNGKITEMAVRDILAGRPVRNIGALANPEALEEFKQFE